ncbi:MAG: hypothetical protein WC532_08665 [Candidatus Omnitrophota bacterium]
MKIWAVILLILIISGCSGYQLSGGRKTTSVERISSDTFAVSFCGNAFMSADEAEKYALQRAAEVTLSKGYSHFIVVKKHDNSEVCMLDLKESYSAPAHADSKTSVSADYQSFTRPNIALTIRCLSPAMEEAPEGSVDAAEFLRKNFPGLGK